MTIIISDEAVNIALNTWLGGVPAWRNNATERLRTEMRAALTSALPFLPVQGAQLSPKDRNIAEIGGLVDTLRSMSHDDNTRACVSVNITASNDLAKKLFDVLHAAPKAATALEAQAAELAAATRRAERALAFIAAAEEAYWLLAWSWQSHLTGPARPFDMSIFTPEARNMMTKAEQCLFDALSEIEP